MSSRNTPSHALPLAIVQGTQYPAHTLPLAIKLTGGQGGNQGNGGQGIPKPKRRMYPAYEMALVGTAVADIALCHYEREQAASVVGSYRLDCTNAFAVGMCLMPTVSVFTPLDNCQHPKSGDGMDLGVCQFMPVAGFIALTNCQKGLTQNTKSFATCYQGLTAQVFGLAKCQKGQTQAVDTDGLGLCLSQVNLGKGKANCTSHKTDKAVAVPCRYYPIPEPPKPPPAMSLCQLPPAAHLLPLKLTRQPNHQSSALPLGLICWHDKQDTHTTTTPTQGTYIMMNVITASIAGIQIDPLSFNIKTDIFSFCWQGSIEMTAKDYQRVQVKLAQNEKQGKDSLINININGFAFTLLAEEVSHHRQFIGNSVSIMGRSLSVHLSSDYATSVPLDNQDYYTSQMVNKQLEHLSVSIDNFAIVDWLVPQGSYTATNKSPIVVINDIAKAAGGFVYSHPSDAKLSILPRHKVPAWELATTQPDRTISLDAIHKMTISTKTNPRYNTVTLVGATQGGIVHREREGRDKEAPTQDNPLYTQREVIIAQGMSVLSDSGKHSQITLDLRLSKKYGLGLATLGEIWQVNDEVVGQVSAWKARVVEVAITAKANNSGVVDVMQTVGLDRYDDI